MTATNVTVTLTFELKAVSLEDFQKMIARIGDNSILPYKELLEIYPIDKAPIHVIRAQAPEMDRTVTIGEAQIDLIV